MKAGRTRYPTIAGVRSRCARRSPPSWRATTDWSTTRHSEILVRPARPWHPAAADGAPGRGDEVLLPDPIYDAYHSPILLCGGRIRSVRSDDRGLPLRAASGRDRCGADSRVTRTAPEYPGILWARCFARTNCARSAISSVRRNLVLIVTDLRVHHLRRRRHISPASSSDECGPEPSSSTACRKPMQ